MEPSKQREKLDRSFEETFSTGKYGDCFKKLYGKMAPSIAELGFDEAFVECSSSRERLDFNLFYKSGLFISVARPVDSKDNVDFFSISRNKKKIIVSQLEHAALLEQLKEVELMTDDYVNGVNTKELPVMLNQNLHNFFTEAKTALGIHGSIDDMASDIGKQVYRAAKELSRQYVDETVMFKDAEHTDPYQEVHYKISWGKEHGENVTEIWDDAVFADDELTGLYCLNVATDEMCDEFEYIKEIKRIKK